MAAETSADAEPKSAKAEPKTDEQPAKAEAEPAPASTPKAEAAAPVAEADTTPQAEVAEDPAPEPAETPEPTAKTDDKPAKTVAAETSADAEPKSAKAEPKTDEQPAKAEAEPAAASAPEAEAAAPVAEADTTPQAEVAEDPAPEPAEAPEPTAKAEPEAEAAAEAAEPKAGAATEADGDATPAAASDPAPEAAADPAPVAAAAAVTAAAKGDAPSTAAKADAPAAAIPLADLTSRAPGLVGAYSAAGEAVQESGLGGQRAVVYLVLDRSGSMRGYFKDGTVSHLAEQALALSAQLDTSGTVPVVFFSTDIDGTADLELDRHTGRIEELHGSLGHMGRTNYHTAVNAVIEHYKASGTTDPAFVIFQTDGAPTTKTAAEKALCEAAGLPLFWQFLAFGDPEAKGFDFLRKLDTSPALAVPEKRAVDNTGFFHAGLDPRTVADAELYRELLKKFPGWLAAREQG
ncbi:VWA domain-containing protein [Streptomyces sp. MK37H]|nr:VWA domain-containing protein [Streptomyces sp. MK37H]